MRKIAVISDSHGAKVRLDMFRRIAEEEKFDMIISNPPYITTQEMLELPESVKGFEPHLALHGGNDGLEFYRSIAELFCKVLKPEGLLCFEFGMGQGDDVCRILNSFGYTVLERSRDYNDRERAVIARYDRKDD